MGQREAGQDFVALDEAPLALHSADFDFAPFDPFARTHITEVGKDQPLLSDFAGSSAVGYRHRLMTQCPFVRGE